jgi:hypothetical protein
MTGNRLTLKVFRKVQELMRPPVFQNPGPCLDMMALIILGAGRAGSNHGVALPEKAKPSRFDSGALSGRVPR